MGAYAALQPTVLHMKRLNQSGSPIFVILFVLCFQRKSFLTFISKSGTMLGRSESQMLLDIMYYQN